MAQPKIQGRTGEARVLGGGRGLEAVPPGGLCAFFQVAGGPDSMVLANRRVGSAELDQGLDRLHMAFRL